jgi:hypothetical protein
LNATRLPCSQGLLFRKQLCQSKHHQPRPHIAFQEDLRPVSFPRPYSDFLLGQFKLGKSARQPQFFLCSDLQLPLDDSAGCRLGYLKSNSRYLADRIYSVHDPRSVFVIFFSQVNQVRRKSRSRDLSNE